MIFAEPQVLWLLLVLPPALALFFWWSRRKRESLVAQFIQARLLPALLAGVSPVRERIRLGCLVLAVVFILLALARPQWGFSWEEAKQRGVDIVVAVDTSKSMLARDIAPNRLTRAKLAALDLMQQAKADRLGLVAFAGQAYLECPLTIDDAAFRQSVQALDVNTIPEGGTALAEAITTALTAFKEGDNHKVLVLLTDGEDHDSGAEEAAKKAAAAGLRIYTIGIGTAEGELLRTKDAQGHEDYVRDEQGNVVKSHLNEGLLQQIATVGGGFYLRLSGARTMDTLYNDPRGLGSLPKGENENKLIKQYQERYQWPLGLAMVLLTIEILLPERKAPRPQSSPAMLKRGAAEAVAAALVAAFVLAGVPTASASPSSALREYKRGDYEDALKEYQQLLQKGRDDPRLHFNAGTAAYRDGRFDVATNQFSAALDSRDLNLQEAAYYNRGNSLYRLGETSQNPNGKTQAWEQAIKDYELSLKLNRQDADAKYNLEFVTKRLEELKKQQSKSNQQKNIEPSEAAKRAKAQADEAVTRREYAQALDIMEKQLAQDPTTAYYGDFIQRLKEVNGVQDSVKR